MRCLLFLALLTIGCSSTAPDPQVEEGRALYVKYCALCHGEQGQGYAADEATAVTNGAFLAAATDRYLHDAIDRGRSGTSMSGWGKALGGPLSGGDIDRIVVFLRAQQSLPGVDLRAYGPLTTGGEPLRAFGTWAAECAACHGKEGKGGKFMSLANPELLASASNAFLRHAIEIGRPGTPMPRFAEVLTDQQLRDLVALVRSWATPVGATPTELPSSNLGDATINPSGPDAAFDGVVGKYVSAAKVKVEFDRGARMVLLDARAPSDYVSGHLPGAVSVPFYVVDDYLSQLPREAWIVAYCACPHAASGAAADALVAKGYKKVKVLDEGIGYWRDQGWPLTVGAKR